MVAVPAATATATDKLSCSACGKRFTLLAKSANGGANHPASSEIEPSQEHRSDWLPKPGRSLGTPLPDDFLPSENPAETPADPNQSIAVMIHGSRPALSAVEILELAAGRRRFKQRLALLAVLLLLCGCSLAVYFVIYPPRFRSSGEFSKATPEFQSDSQPQGESKIPDFQPDRQASVLDSAQSGGPLSSPGNSPASKTAKSQVPDPPQPIGWTPSRNLSRRELEKLWTQVQPYTIGLVVHFPQGDVPASGLLIDSRGWVVTALSAVQGAKSITASTAPSNPLAEAAEETLSDEVRGVLAIDRSRDLVLLQVNRRLVNAVTALQPTEQLMVGGRSLVQAAALGPERVAWLTETRIFEELPREKFSSELGAQVEARRLDLSPYWPAHDRPWTSGTGAALYTTDGKLAGLNVGLRDSDRQFFVEAPQLLALVNQAREPPAALASLIPAAAQAMARSADGSAVDFSAGQSPFSADHPASRAAIEMYETGLVCEVFNWQPRTPTQHRELRDALIAYRDLALLLRERKLVKADADPLREQFAFWTRRLETMLLTRNESLLIEHNSAAWSALESSESEGGSAAAPTGPPEAALFVKVALQPGASPRLVDRDTVTLQVLGREKYLILPVDEQTAPLLPDTNWLVVLSFDQGVEVTLTNGSERWKAERGGRLWEIAEWRPSGLFGEPISENKTDQNADRPKNDDH